MEDTFRVRIGHFSPDAPALDVLVDGYPVLTGVEFGDVNDYTEHRADEYELAVTRTDGGDVLLESPVDFEPDTDYTLLLVGEEANLEARLLVDGH